MSDQKEITTVNDDELAGLLNQNQQLQEKENAGEGVRADYIILAKSASKALNKRSDLFIEGLQLGQFYIQKEKKILGNELRVVPLAFLTLYNEMENTTKDAKFFGAWNKTQAQQFPLVENSYFNRQLPNGHILVPVNWVMVEVLGHREIEKAVISYKSTGSRIWKAWKEDAKNRSGSSATLVYTLFEDEYSNTDYTWTDINFRFTENLLETDKAEAVHCLKKSNSIREADDKCLLISNRVIAQVVKELPTRSANLPDASTTEESYDDEEAGF